MASHEPPHLRRLRSWNPTIPRFLFRGFNEYSGGNQELNTPTAVTPHAFLGGFVDFKNDESVGSGVDFLSGPRRKFCPPSPTTLNSMSLEAFRSEIDRHLQFKNTVSHFSSWTPDFQTALAFSWSGPNRPRGLHRHIGIFDTSRRDEGNVILHVRALREEGHTNLYYDQEYLVYGPVKGISYTCLAFPYQQHTPLCNPLHPPLYPGRAGWPGYRRRNDLSDIRKAYNKAARYSFYHAAGTAQEARWGSCTNTALYLTIIAAEWSQEVSLRYELDLLAPWTNSPQAETQWWQALVSDLSEVMEWAARDATLVLPLVNPLTHLANFPDLGLMIKLLLCFEAEIIRLRSNHPPAPSPEPWSLTRFLRG